MIKRYINADAYASTGDDFLGFNMFAYCNNQPVNYIDSSGERPCAGTSVNDETPEERHTSCQWMNEQAQSKTTTDVIIYYHNENSSSNFDVNAYENPYSSNPVYKPVADHEDLVDALEEIESEHVNDVYMYIHGAEGELCFWQYSYMDFDQFPEINIYGDVYLFVCHGGSIASDVANATGSSVIATPFSVSFESNGYARAGYESLARNFVDCFDGIWRIYSPDGSVNNLKEGIILG